MTKKERRAAAEAAKAANAASPEAETTHVETKSEFEQSVESAAATVEHVEPSEEVTAGEASGETAAAPASGEAKPEKKVIERSLPKADKPLHKIKDADDIVAVVKSDPQCGKVSEAEIVQFVTTQLPNPAQHAPKNAYQAVTRLRRLHKARVLAEKKGETAVPTFDDLLPVMMCIRS